MRKNGKQERQNETPSRHFGGENFPFPAQQREFRQPATVVEGGEDEDEATMTKTSGRVEDGLAVASIQVDEQVEEIVLDEGLDSSNVDLRTMIISSELLKPKYLEE